MTALLIILACAAGYVLGDMFGYERGYFAGEAMRKLREEIEEYSRYWQHGETGRVLKSVAQPPGDWYEITKQQYEEHG